MSSGSFFTTEDGTQLWYNDLGGNGVPIVLHHGHTATRANWGHPHPDLSRSQGTATLLSAVYKHRVIVMECRGTGDSGDGLAGTRNIPQFAKDVVALLDHLNIPRAVFGGHSMGGGVGFQLACHHENRLQSLVLLAPIPAGGFTSSSSKKAKIAAIPLPDIGDYYLRPGSHSDDEELDFRRRCAWHPAQTEDWFVHRLTAQRRCTHTEEGWQSMYTLDLEQKISSIRMPVLMIAGAADSLLPANIADFERMPSATLHVVAHAGHEIAVHAPDDVARAIDAFIRHGAHNYKQVARMQEAADFAVQHEMRKRKREALRRLLSNEAATNKHTTSKL